MSTQRKPRHYRQVVEFVGSRAWLLEPSYLMLIRELIAYRLEGGVLTREEIEERINGGRNRPSQQTQNAIAVIPLWGLLVPHAGVMVDVSTPGTGMDAWLETFREAVNDKSVRTILLNVDSPGGSAELISEVSGEVRAARSRKQVVAVANTLAASAAYSIASQADRLYLTPSGMVGSVGAYTIHEDISAKLEAEGIKPTLIAAPVDGFKAENVPFKPLSAEAEAHLQEIVDSAYDLFLGDVALGRRVNRATVESQYGRGRVLPAKQALAAGMVDGIASFDEVLAALVAGDPLPGEEPRRRSEAELPPTRELEPEPELVPGPGELVLIGPSGFELHAETPAEMAALGSGLSAAAELQAISADPQLRETLLSSRPTPTVRLDPAGSAQLDATAVFGRLDTPQLLEAAIPPRSTEVIDEPWDGPAAVAACEAAQGPLRALHAWVDSEGDPAAKGAYKFPHHRVTDGRPNAANINGVRNALARLPQADIPDADRAGVERHLQRHMDDWQARQRDNANQAAMSGSHEGADAMETRIGEPRTSEELAAEQDQISARMRELHETYAGEKFPDEVQREFDELAARRQELEETRENIRQRMTMLADDPRRGLSGTAGLRDRRPVGGIRSNVETTSGLPENLFDIGAYRALARDVEQQGELFREGARRLNASIPYETSRDAEVREFVERLLSVDDSKEKDSFAQRVLITADPLYDRAFGKFARGIPLDAREQERIRMAVSHTGLGSETPVPVTIDPTVLLTSDGATNPMRQIARIVTITGKTWRGITSEGVTFAYEAELNAVTDQTPAFDAPEAEVAKAHAEVQFSIEVDQDWPAFRAEMARAFADAKDMKEADKFLNGTGTNEPEGLIYALNADGGSTIPTGTKHALALTDLDLVTDAMPPRFDASARWLATKAFYSKMRALAGAASRMDIWVPLSQGFQTATGITQYGLVGYPVAVASEISSDFDLGGANVAVLGDFQRGFVIVDRVGMNVELDPLVRNADGKLIGARALYLYFRNTSKLLAANAFRMLQVQAT